jgi:DNA/RNA endonuclease YhcR with UshA esterase domain
MTFKLPDINPVPVGWKSELSKPSNPLTARRTSQKNLIADLLCSDSNSGMKTILAISTVLTLTAFGALAGLTNNATPVKISAADADKHYDEEMIVTGKIAQVTTHPTIVFLNLDKPYPDSPFTAVIQSQYTNEFGDVSLLNGKSVEVQGKVKKYHDKPEIALESTNQLKVADQTNNATPVKISAADADKHYDEEIIVTGKIAQVTVHPTIVFLNFDKPYPDSPFTAVIQSEYTNEFGDVSLLNGKSVEVHGQVKKYHEKPEIALKSTNQLRVVRESVPHNIGTNLQAVLVNAKETLKRLDEQSDFILTVLAAEADDRGAYEKLIEWSENPDFKFRDQAFKAVEEVQISHVTSVFNDRPYMKFDWIDGDNHDSWNMNQIEARWQAVSPELARAYLEFVWGATNINKEQKLAFVHSVLTNSRNSLQAADRAAHLLSEELKAKYNPPFIYDDIENKWQEYLKTNHVAAISTNKVTRTP